MANMLATGAKGAAYGAAQLARVSWFSLHYFAGRHLAGPLTPPGEAPYAEKSGPFDAAALTGAFRTAFLDEWEEIRSGKMKLPAEMRRLPNPVRAFRSSRAYMREARAVSRRKFAEGGNREVRDSAEGAYPSYYLQNFHFQSDGWLSADSARIYDMQVETLFTGAAGVMRRQAIPEIGREISRLKERGLALSDLRLVDLACGTAPLAADIKDNFSGLPVTLLDLSPDYLDEARKRLATLGGVDCLTGAAEQVPLEDDSADIMVSVYLFHELPPKIRREVVREIARVLKPGGLYLHLDTIQYGDLPGLDILLETFPRGFYEPYYDSYCREDLSELFDEAGLVPEISQTRFLTKMNSFRKPGA